MFIDVATHDEILRPNQADPVFHQSAFSCLGNKQASLKDTFILYNLYGPPITHQKGRKETGEPALR